MGEPAEKNVKVTEEVFAALTAFKLFDRETYSNVIARAIHEAEPALKAAKERVGAEVGA